MEPEGSLQHSQQLAACPYPEPDQSSPYPPTSHILRIHRNIFIPSTPGSPKWPLSLRFPYQNSVCTFLLPHTFYMPRPSHYSRFHYPKYIWWEVQIIKFLVMYEGWNFNSGNYYLLLIQNRYMFRSFTVLQCSHQHCVQPVASDVEVVGYL